MPCYKPLTGYRSDVENFNTGKRGIVFKQEHAQWPLNEVTIPCGSCIGCRFERSRQWALRCVHEASLHDEKCFLTLTYDPEHLPKNNSLNKRHFQLFMKRLRKHYADKKIGYYMCGEYGEQNTRPHYHACIFGMEFEDKIFHSTTKNGDKLYKSTILSKIWHSHDRKTREPVSGGFCTIGELNFKTAAYTARYIMKKINGKKADEHYRYTNEKTGEQFQLEPEYTSMSLKPAIGKNWYLKFKTDVYPTDEVIIKGISMQPPTYYDKLLEKEEPHLHEIIKHERLLNAKKYSKDNTPERLHVKHKVKQAQANLLSRTLEEI